MDTSFECPKCGAPISFEPHPGDTTVVCSFCRDTVVIPEELRVPLPKEHLISRQDAVEVKNPPAKRSFWLWIIIGFILIVVLIGVIPTSNSTDSLSSVDAPAVSPSETIDSNCSVVSQTTLEAQSTLEVQATDDANSSTATQAASDAQSTLEAQATLDALQSLLKQEQGWPAILKETFTDNKHKWNNGDVRNGSLTGSQIISKGVYTWKVSSDQSVFDSVFPNIADQTDFLASVDLKYYNMPADDSYADSGLIFRYNNTDQTWYYFSINNQGQYYFGLYDGKAWNSLIPETDSAAIHPGETNRLTVGAQGSQFIFSINDQLVDHFNNDQLKSGSIGVAINLPQKDEKANLEFSNFTVLATSSNP